MVAFDKKNDSERSFGVIIPYRQKKLKYNFIEKNK